MRCGVLALQGDFAAHAAMLERLGAVAVEVRTVAGLDGVEALVLPGGESTTMLRLMDGEGLLDAVGERIDAGMPVLATCAGVVLLAREITPAQPSLARLDVAVRRNAYGRQVASTVVALRLDPALGEPGSMDGVFIRAPRIERLGPDVQALAWRGDDPVLVRQGRLLAATFHPELTDDLRVHRLFLAMAGG